MFILSWPLAAAAQDAPRPIGRVKAVSGVAAIVRGAETLPAIRGALVFETDQLRTGADGQIGLMLQDETRLSLGPGSEVSLAAFAFDPAAGRLSMVLRVVRGAIAYVSGRIAALAPDRVRIETPSMVIGVRGTHLLIKAGTQ